MTSTVLNPVYPVAAQTLLICKEATTGTPPAVANFVTMPVADFGPDPKQQMLKDMALRGSLTTGPFDLLPGPYWAESAIKESPLFGDTIGHILNNLMGDFTSTGTSQSTTWTTSAALTPGAGPIPVTTGTAATAGTYVQIGTVTGTTEVVEVGTGSTTTSIVLNAATPIRLSHASAVTITLVAAPFTHVFSLLNPGSLTGSVTGQPPTHSFAHRNQVAGSAGYYADLYPYGCLSQLKLSGAASGLLTWSGNLTSWPQQAPVSAFTIAPSTVRAIPSWRGTSTEAGTAISNVTTWGITLNREVEPIPTVDGQQSPSVIARGGLAGTFDLNVNPAVDESQLNYYLNNTQPTLLWTTSNGLTGASQVSFSVAAQLAGYGSSKLTANKTTYGYVSSGDLIVNPANAGQSGGFAPCQITLINAVATY
jgi:hypothetical protein